MYGQRNIKLEFMFSVYRVSTPTQTEELWTPKKKYYSKIIQQ